MRFNELNKGQIKNLLEELFSLKGAKEVFEKHNVEMITKDIEIKELFNFIEDVKALYDNSETIKEYKQAIMFLNTQIKTNEELLKTSEGFMKTMLQGMIAGFKTTKETAVKSQTPIFRKEVEELLERIINDEDRNKIKGLLEKISIDNETDFVKGVKAIEKDIENRYYNEQDNSEEKVVEVKEEKKETVKKEVEEKPKKVKEEHKKEDKVEEKEEKKTEEIKQDDDEFNGLDDIDLEDFGKEPEENNGELFKQDLEELEELNESKKETEDDDWLNGFDDEDTDLGEIGEIDLENPFI